MGNYTNRTVSIRSTETKSKASDIRHIIFSKGPLGGNVTNTGTSGGCDHGRS